MAIGRDGLGGRRKTRAGRAVRGALALILLAGALVLPALPVHADATDDLFTVARFNSTPTGPSFITALIEGGANPNARDDDGWTPLQVAAQWNSNPSVIAALIAGGADPDARDDDGYTALHLAARWNFEPSVASMIVALIAGGADPGARNYDGKTPFDYAKANRALKGTEAYRLLSEGWIEPAPPVHADATAALFDAAESGTASDVKAALAAGADVAARNERGDTPLHYAAGWNPNLSVIRALIEAGADVEERTSRDEGWWVPLHIAAHTNPNPAVVEALILAGADLDARDKYGDTPLHKAGGSAGYNNDANSAAAKVAVLIEAGANPNARNKFGNTPLHAATGYALASSPPIVALIEGGADPAARNDDGIIPFDWAKDNPLINEALKGTEAYRLLNPDN